MIDASIELEEFELVEAAPGTALLRIAARSTLRQGSRPPHLVIQRARERHRLSPLPAPPDASGKLRVAFSAPSAILASAGFSLELPDGSLVSLPAPRRSQRIVQQHADAQAQQSELLALRETAAGMAGQLDEAETRVAALADVVRRQSAERDAVDERLEGAEQARLQAAATIEALVAQVDRLAERAAAAEALLTRARSSPADIAAAGSAASVIRPDDPETGLSVEAVTGLILVVLGIAVALLIITGVIHT